MVLRFVVSKADEAPIWNFSPTIPALSLHYLVKMEPVVGLALHHCCVPTLTNSKQFNRLRSFPSEITGFQRPLRKSRTILPIAVQNFLTILSVSIYWSFYWRSR